jgi:UDP-N-acetylmuramate dehydrogenase
LPEHVEIQEYVDLAPFTTLKIGGRARFFVRATDTDHVVAAVTFAEKRAIPIFVLGGGSNVVVSDREFAGVVLHIAILGKCVVEQREHLSPDTVILRAAAGEDWDGFVNYCVSLDLGGIECLSGIPGLVGGTPVQNVGAYGQEVSETIVGLEVYDRKLHIVRRMTNEECRFAYRSSIFNTAERERYIVLSVDFKLLKGSEPHLTYRDLQTYFGESLPTLSEVREAVIKIRRAKSMVIDVADRNSKSVGSFFKNPVVENAVFDQISTQYSPAPCYPVNDTHVKIPAAWLIENAGFSKGYKRGNAGISTNHTLALINLGGATANDMIGLMEEIVEGVENKFAIRLTPEPVFIGF